jgi:hypothetical protein
MLLLLRAVVVMGLTSAVVGLRGSGLRLNPVTGGYEDISVVVGEELPASSCPQILDNIKVYWVRTNVPDPNPPDPYVFRPPGSRSGSTSQRYGSRIRILLPSSKIQ